MSYLYYGAGIPVPFSDMEDLFRRKKFAYETSHLGLSFNAEYMRLTSGNLVDNWLIRNRFSQFPLQCGVVVLGGWEVLGLLVENRLKDHVSKCELVAKALNYTRMYISMIDYVDDFKAVGFREVDSFKNRRTGRSVSILIKELVYEEAAQ
jgi:hypothetical protein